jgi:hypothetical protein
MNQKTIFRLVFLVCISALAVGFSVPAPATVDGSAEPCCFANDRYEGTCKIIPGEGETCQSILEYLKNPMSTGKTYCGNTSVRGGWVQVDCKTGKSIPRQDAAGSTSNAPNPAVPHEDGTGK